MRSTLKLIQILAVIIVFIVGVQGATYPKPANCESNKDCLKGKARCIRRECHCNHDRDYGDGKTRCTRWKKCSVIFSHICRPTGADTHATCLSENGFNKNTCKCKRGYFGRWDFYNPKCMSTSYINGKWPCLTDKNCPKSASCKNNKCICKDELTGDGEQCEHSNRLVTCSSNSDCHKEGTCFHGRCRCLGWFSGNGKYCRKVTKSCPAVFKCGSRSSCLVDPLLPKKPYCRCNMGYYTTLQGKCVECMNNRHCKQTYSICIKGECGCPNELILGKKSCEPAPLKSCKRNKDCHPKAECQDGKCVCQGRRAGDGKNCRDALKKSCPKKNKCSTGSTCLLDPSMPRTPLCKCNKGLVKSKNGKCVECLSDKHCQAAYLQCTKGACKCKNDLIPDGPEGKTCKPGPLHPCTKAEDCHKDAECQRGKCHCKGQSAGNGKICRASLPCPQEHNCDGNSVCVVDPFFPDKPDCKCNFDFKKSDDGTCVEMTECEKIGLTCSGGQVCKQVNDSYGCSCPDGFNEILDGENKICQDTDECQKPDACPANSKCQNTEGAFECNCKEGYQKNVFGACEEEKCTCGPNGKCDGEKCSCNPGFVEKDGVCEDVDECAEDDALCLGDGEQCENQEGAYSCTCKQGYVDKSGGCVKTDKAKGECNCKRNEECHQGKCECKKGYMKSPQGKCVRKSGNFQGVQGVSGRSVQVTSHLGALVLALLGRLAFTV